jgi:guanylate kinase
VSSGVGRRGIPFVVTAPSGTGKTTVCREVVARSSQVEFSVSHTTRPRRREEVDGVDYHFVTVKEFQALAAGGAFLESAIYSGNHYGTSWGAIDGPLASGRSVLLEIETQGARQVRERRSDARFIFLLPPSMKVLEERLRGRGTDSDQQVAGRLAMAREEVEAVRDFDYAVVNDEFERCVEGMIGIICGEREGSVGELRRRFAPDAALDRFRAGGD